jgi:opacity protein-like surface antigen
MQKYLVAAALAAAFGVGGTASAADVYSGSLKDGPVYLANTWTGFYIGGHFGAAWGRDKVRDLDDFVLQGSITKNDTGASGVYGLQTGYNWQRGNIVFGVEIDLGALDLNHRQNILFNDTNASLNSGIYGDVTGRLGYSFGQSLIYAKGGFAFFDGKADVLDNGSARDTNTFTGWTVGGGLEYALNPGWSVKAEYLHFDFDKENSTIAFSSGDVFRFSHDLTVDTVKAGLNYHLGHGFEPLK